VAGRSDEGGNDADAAELSLGPLDDPDALGREWRDLEARADGSFFLSWRWLGCWLESFPLRPLVLRARAGARTVGLALLQPARGRRHGWLPVDSWQLHRTGDAARDAVAIEYNGLLLDRAYPATLPGRALAFLAGSGAWDELVLAGVTADWQQPAMASGLRVRLLARQPSYRVPLDRLRAAGGDYPASLSANARGQLRRALRVQAAHGPLSATAADGPEQALAYFEALRGLHAATWRQRGQPGAFAHPEVLAFHRRLIAAGTADGSVELLRLAAGDRAFGYLYLFVHRGWVGYYASGFAADADPHAKPGLVSHCLAIGRHLALGRDCYDFMAGAQRYKASLGVPGPEIVTLALQRPRAKLRLEDALRALAHRFGRRG